MRQEDVWNKLYGDNLTWKKETIGLPRVLKGKRVLELGVGTGKTLIAILRQRPKEIFAIDFSGKAADKSRKVFENGAKIIKADARKLPFENNYFDVVVCYYVLNNSLKKDRIKIIKEIYRVLKSRGMCIFEDFSVNDFRNNGKKHRTDKNTVVKKNKLICHFFDEGEIRELFEKFPKIKIKTYRFNPIKYNNDLKREIIQAVAIK